MTYMTYPQLKASAKARLKPVTGTFLGAAAIYYGLTILAGQFSSVSSVFIQSFPLQTVLFFLFSMLSSIFTSMLGAGLHYMLLKLYCGRPVTAGDVFYTFTNQTKTCLGVSCIMSLITTLPTMPAYILFMRFSMKAEELSASAIASGLDASAAAMPPEILNLLSAALFCYTPALVLTTILGIIYSQVYYLMLDFPSCTIKQLFQGSRMLMRGHKGRYFYIQVCMLPIILIIGIPTCGIGMLWITPFIHAVTTEFYLDLVTKRKR